MVLDNLYSYEPREKILGFSRREGLKILENRGEANLNDATEYTFNVTDVNNMYDWREADIIVQGYVTADSGDFSVPSNIPVFVSDAYALFRRLWVTSSGKLCCDTGASYSCANGLKYKWLTDVEFDLAQTSSTESGFYRDSLNGLVGDPSLTFKRDLIYKTGEEGVVATATPKGNKNTFNLNLGYYTGFFGDLSNTITGCPFEIKLERETDYNKVFYVQSTSTNPKFVIEKLWIDVPRVTLAPETQLLVNSQLASTTWTHYWRSFQTFRSDLYKATSQPFSASWRVAALNNQPLRLFFWVSVASRFNATSNVPLNNSFHNDTQKYNTIVNVELNGVSYPSVRLVKNHKRDVARIYKLMQDASGKGISTGQSSAISINDILINELQFIVIPFNVNDDQLFKAGQTSDLILNIECGTPDNTDFYCFCAVECARETRFDYLDNKVQNIF